MWRPHRRLRSARHWWAGGSLRQVATVLSPTSETYGAAEIHDAAPVVELRGVGVRYRVPRGGVRSIKEYLLQAVRGQLRFDDFWALEQVDIAVGRAERLGVIGRNGAGKSTLL